MHFLELARKLSSTFSDDFWMLRVSFRIFDEVLKEVARCNRTYRHTHDQGEAIVEPADLFHELQDIHTSSLHDMLVV